MSAHDTLVTCALAWPRFWRRRYFVGCWGCDLRLGPFPDEDLARRAMVGVQRRVCPRNEDLADG